MNQIITVILIIILGNFNTLNAQDYFLRVNSLDVEKKFDLNVNTKVIINTKNTRGRSIQTKAYIKSISPDVIEFQPVKRKLDKVIIHPESLQLIGFQTLGRKIGAPFIFLGKLLIAGISGYYPYGGGYSTYKIVRFDSQSLESWKLEVKKFDYTSIEQL